MSKTILDVTHLQLSPRVCLQPGDRFIIQRGSGPVWRDKDNPSDPIGVGAPAGEYLLLKLYRLAVAPKRTYADAMNLAIGCTHTLFVDGPAHRSRLLPPIENRPYKLRRPRGRRKRNRRGRGK